MIEYTYRLAKDQDGELLVTVKPLMSDIEKSIHKMMDIPIDTLTQEDKEIFNLKILGLKTIFEFLGALVQEQTLKDAAKELNGTVNIQTNQMIDELTQVQVLH